MSSPDSFGADTEYAFFHYTTLPSFQGDTPEHPNDPSGPLERRDPELLNNVVIGDHIDEEDDDIPTERNEHQAGYYLTTPFFTDFGEGDFGQEKTVYFDPALAIGYGFFMDNDNAFTAFEVSFPMPLGDDRFSIHYGGSSYSLGAGELFDFTAINPDGVTSFLLMGIDESELLPGDDNNPPFVFGARFRDSGFGIRRILFVSHRSSYGWRKCRTRTFGMPDMVRTRARWYWRSSPTQIIVA